MGPSKPLPGVQRSRVILDHIDMVDRIMYEHCTECGHKWTITQAQTQASQA